MLKVIFFIFVFRILSKYYFSLWKMFFYHNIMSTIQFICHRYYNGEKNNLTLITPLNNATPLILNHIKSTYLHIRLDINADRLSSYSITDTNRKETIQRKKLTTFLTIGNISVNYTQFFFFVLYKIFNIRHNFTNVTNIIN